MIDVYRFEPSAEEIAEDRRKALWGRFEQSSKANYVPPELRAAAVIRPENPSTKKRVPMKYQPAANGKNQLGVAKCEWYPEAQASAINCPPIFGHSPATSKLKGMSVGEVLYFKTISREKSHQLRNAILRHSRREDMTDYKFALSKSQEFVRVERLAKTTPNPCDVGQG